MPHPTGRDFDASPTPAQLQIQEAVRKQKAAQLAKRMQAQQRQLRLIPASEGGGVANADTQATAAQPRKKKKTKKDGQPIKYVLPANPVCIRRTSIKHAMFPRPASTQPRLR